MLLIGKPSVSMGHLYHGYVKSPEGIWICEWYVNEIRMRCYEWDECTIHEVSRSWVCNTFCSLHFSDSIWVTFVSICPFDTAIWHDWHDCHECHEVVDMAPSAAAASNGWPGRPGPVLSPGPMSPIPCVVQWGSSLLCLPRLDRFVVWKMWRGGPLAKHLKQKSWSTLQKSSKSWCSKSSADVVFFHTLFDSVLKEVSPDVQCHVVTFM